MTVTTRDDLVSRLRGLGSSLRAFGVAALHIYGSRARDEAPPDIDLLADFAPGQEPDLSRFIGAYHKIEDTFPGT